MTENVLFVSLSVWQEIAADFNQKWRPKMDYSEMQDYSDWQHSRYMRWVHDERGTVEVEKVLNERQES